MEQKMLKNLAVNQLKTLAQMAQAEGFSDLQNQFDFMILSLNNEGAVQEKRETSHFVNPYNDSDYIPLEDLEDEDFDGEYGYDDELDRIPAGFDSREEYENFVRSQNGERNVEDFENGEQIEVIPDDVAGIVEDENGEYKEVGNFNESLETVYRGLEESNTIRDEETGEELYRNPVEPVYDLSIKFSRENGELLSADDVKNRIFTHPQSRMMLDVFGDDFNVENTDNDNEKIVNFLIDQNNDDSRKMAEVLKNGTYASFGGRIVFPGLGLVSAEPVF